MTDSKELCYGCRSNASFQDRLTHRWYCNACAMDERRSSRDVNMQYLGVLLPFGVGDLVECRAEGKDELYEGNGVIEEVSTELKDGGTPVHPAFRVFLYEKADGSDPSDLWYTSCCLKRIVLDKVENG